MTTYLRSFLPSPKAVFCPALEWKEGMDEDQIYREVIKALQDAEQCPNGIPIPISPNVFKYLCYLHGHHPDELAPVVKMPQEDGWKLIDLNLKLDHLVRVRKIETFKRAHHHLFGDLYDQDLIVPLAAGFLVHRKALENHMSRGVNEDAYCLFLGPLDAAYLKKD